MLEEQNKEYWRHYQPGQIPSPGHGLPEELIREINGKVLDVGTGDGALAEKLSDMGLEVQAIDIAENVILENQKRNTGVQYSTQDITKRTDLPDNDLDLIIFNYTLTNIHREAWKSLGEEVFRLLKPSGKLWLFEPMVSEAYRERYKLADNFVADSHCVFVFFDHDLASKVKTKADLEKAIQEERVSRIIKHYTQAEIQSIFAGLKLIHQREVRITSPSGFEISSFEGLFIK